MNDLKIPRPSVKQYYFIKIKLMSCHKIEQTTQAVKKPLPTIIKGKEPL
jgi:hypothetical protein